MKLGSVLLSCEHAVNHVPSSYAWLFADQSASAELQTHLGYDIGAFTAAKMIASTLAIELHVGTITRLLVDLNRSRAHALDSRYCQQLTQPQRLRLVEQYHQPHWTHIQDSIARNTAPVCHIGVHSFTPVYENQVRDADIGLLYDPSRANEHDFCATWEKKLQRQDPTLRVRHNYPYLGTADGMTTSLRQELSASDYLGIELEINQSIFFTDKTHYSRVIDCVAVSLANAVAQHERH